ncbi:flavin-containing monooxygenase [Glutamicibacter sp. AOP12-B1-11]|uniref:flavin-containing monooxygenase n=1 Tax=Glutamicibacter sp. AOP12-B1-11 TaxID=3457725 RepID=UPI004033C6BF
MSSQETEVLVVGAGQAGVAMSEHLTNLGVPHIVLEKDRIAERWRTGRWDSLVANGPAWHDRFPGMTFADVPADGFAPKESVADYFAAYAEGFGAPIRSGVEVKSVQRNNGKPGFKVETSEGIINTRFVVAATGPFQIPVIPPIVADSSPLTQMHSHSYRNPQQLRDGGVLVVGAGSSGVQIANELRAAGRQVYLSVGPHDRPPRQYRGQDFCWWLGVLDKWSAAAPPKGAEHVTIAVSGANGGHTVNFRELAAGGIKLLGRTETYSMGKMRFAPDLARNIANGDANYLSVLDEADAYIARNGLNFPEEPQARVLGDDPEELIHPILEMDLEAAGVTTIIWATGFAVDYQWLQVNTFDEQGRPLHQRGVSEESGVYFLGQPWQSSRGSSFIWGVWHDAKYVAEQIDIQRGYLEHMSQIDLDPAHQISPAATARSDNHAAHV